METKAKALREISDEISRLEKQRGAAETEAEAAAERLKEISSRKGAFTPNASVSERGIAKELEALATALDEESASLSRTKAIAEDAVREIDRLILEAEVRHREAEKRLARGRYEALCEKRYSLDGEAEDAMAGLVEVLDDTA
jgi:dsDNA-specific endonuclease/ATPase MutS2